MKYDDTIIVIPARYGSTRLPGKSIADINGIPMVARVMNIAKNINLCNVIVATEDKSVIQIVEKFDGKALLTSNDLKSGTDRVFQALQKLNREYKYIVNLQGDMPNIKGEIIKKVIDLLHDNNDADIITAVCKTQNQDLLKKPQCVKAVLAYNQNKDFHKCLYFSRSIVPYNCTDGYIHIGIYGYKQESLKKFVSLPQSNLEKIEKLEQLRALENNMHIYTFITDNLPIGVDTKEDLDLARQIIK